MFRNMASTDSIGLVNDRYYKWFLPLLTLTMYELVRIDSFFAVKY